MIEKRKMCFTVEWGSIPFVQKASTETSQLNTVYFPETKYFVSGNVHKHALVVSEMMRYANVWKALKLQLLAPKVKRFLKLISSLI